MTWTPEIAVFGAMVVTLAGALAAGAAAWRFPRTGGPLALLATVVAALFAGVAAIRVLAAGPGSPWELFRLPHLGFALRLHVDGLSAVFLLLTAGVSVPVAVFSLGHLGGAPPGTALRYHPPFLVFLGALYGLVSTTDMMGFFFVFWQLMTLPGAWLIAFDRDSPASRRAARKYLLLMQVACALTLVGAALLAGGGPAPPGSPALRYDFDTVASRLPLLLQEEPATATIAFALLLVGFGIKLGMWPFGGLWLPDAHPAAPAPISAMLSGVMIKTGVYGLARVFLWLVPPEGHAAFPALAWGAVLVAFGTVTLVTGTFSALEQSHAKRLLACSSMGQAGYLLFGLGTALCLLGSSHPSGPRLAALAVAGVLIHTLCHGAVKALLFLDAGALGDAAGTVDLNRLGGLAARMPFLAGTAFLAGAALAGLPLFAGYPGKWGLAAGALAGGRAAWFLPLSGAVALLASALTLAVMLKFVGLAYLTPGRANRPTPAAPWNAGPARHLACGLLAVLVLGFGLAPSALYQLAARALAASPHSYGPVLAAGLPVESAPGLFGPLPGLDTGAAFAPAVVGSLLVLLTGLVLFLARIGQAPRRAVEPWLCGYATAREAPGHPATGFALGFRRFRSAPLPSDSTPPGPANPAIPGTHPPGNASSP